MAGGQWGVGIRAFAPGRAQTRRPCRCGRDTLIETAVGRDRAGWADPAPGARRAETPSSMFADCPFLLNPHCWLKTAARTDFAMRSAECPVPAGKMTKGICRPDAPGPVGSKKNC